MSGVNRNEIMKIKRLFLTALLLTVSSIGFAQSKTKSAAPDAIVKKLYAAQKSGSGPFFQTKNRAVVDRYFTKKFADLIWKDALAARGEVGAIDFDPLYGSQDPRITDFTIMETGWGGDSKFGGADEAVVQVTFKDSGAEQMVSFEFKQGKDKNWKIYDIRYRSSGAKLIEILSNAASVSLPGGKTVAEKGTIEHLAQTVSDAFEKGTLGRLDAQKPLLNTVEIVIENTLSDGKTSRRFKTLKAGERWFRGTRKEANFEGNEFEKCAKGVCTFAGGILHNTLFLNKITYTVVKGRPLIKSITFLDGN